MRCVCRCWLLLAGCCRRLQTALVHPSCATTAWRRAAPPASPQQSDSPSPPTKQKACGSSLFRCPLRPAPAGGNPGQSHRALAGRRLPPAHPGQRVGGCDPSAGERAGGGQGQRPRRRPVSGMSVCGMVLVGAALVQTAKCQSVRVLLRCSFAAGGGHAQWHGLTVGRLRLVKIQQYLVRKVWPFGHDVVVVSPDVERLDVCSREECAVASGHAGGIAGPDTVSVFACYVL